VFILAQPLILLRLAPIAALYFLKQVFIVVDDDREIN